MVSLKLAVETSDAVRNVNQAGTAMEDTGRKAEIMGRRLDGLQEDVVGLRREVNNAADAFDVYGLNATKVLTVQQELQRRTQAATAAQQQFVRSIGATTEVASIGARVRLLGEEVRNLGSGFSSAASVGNALAGALIDVAQVSAKATGGISALTAAVRANPLLAAATVITGIATAMSFFGGETKTANEELTKQIQLQKQLAEATTDLQTKLQRNADLQAAGFNVEPGSAQRLRAEQLVNVASGLAGQQGIIRQDRLAELSGVSVSELLRRAGPYGVTSQPMVGSNFTPEQARTVLLAIASELRQQSEVIVNQEASRAAQQVFLQGQQLRPGLYGPTLPPDGVPVSPIAPSNLFPDVRTLQPGVGYSSAIGPMPGEESPFSRVQRLNEIQAAEQSLDDFNRRLAETRQLGQEVGTALGNSFFGFLQNANNARQVLVGLLQQLAAIGQASVVRGFASQIGNLFAPTAPQAATSNSNMVPGSFGPQPAPGFQG